MFIGSRPQFILMRKSLNYLLLSLAAACSDGDSMSGGVSDGVEVLVLSPLSGGVVSELSYLVEYLAAEMFREEASGWRGDQQGPLRGFRWSGN